MKKLYNNSLVEKPLPDWAIEKNIKSWFFYTGKSMNPTFKEGDIIFTKVGSKIVSGDIIVFREKIFQRITVHRVVYFTKEGLITRGDNNSFFDRVPVTQEQILGIAEYFDNGGRIKVVPNGDKNLNKLKMKWKTQGLLKILKFPYRLFYRAIKRTRIVQFLFGKWFERKIIKIFIENSAGSLIKFIYKGKTIAVKWSTGLFSCKRPFDLLIDDPKII